MRRDVKADGFREERVRRRHGRKWAAWPALGAGLLSARMSYAAFSGTQKFFLVLLTVAAGVGGALFFFGKSGAKSG